jgi:uncharacterized protein YoaH (UPF0181 family)
MLSPAAAAKGRRRGPTVLESIREAEKRAQEAALAKEKEAQRRARVRTDVTGTGTGGAEGAVAAAHGASGTSVVPGPLATGQQRPGGAPQLAIGAPTVVLEGGASGGDAVGNTALLLHEKKKQKLLGKAKSRPYKEVMGCGPVGMADIGSQPRLEAFVTEGRSSDEAIALHAVAMRDWMAKNISKKAMQKDTEVRASFKFTLRGSQTI